MRVLLVDDHRIVREGIRTLLERHTGVEVVGEARDGEQAVAMALELLPDVVILDLSLPKLNGVEAARLILAEAPQIRIVVLSMHSDKRFVTESLRAGVAAYLVKDSAIEELVVALKEVAKGRMYLSSQITGVVVQTLVEDASAEEEGLLGQLSSRERQVMQQLAEGSNVKEIGASLGLSPKTIETHRKNLMDKLGLQSIAELTRVAIREGLIPLE